MGWSSASEIFDRVAEALLRECTRTDNCVCTAIAEELIAALQEGDWDTEEESLERFAENGVIAQAFANRGVHLPRDNEEVEER